MELYDLPKKMFFRIGEVSQLVGVDPHVLRYWESEFVEVNPPKGKGRQRMYRREDVLTLIRIKDLLYAQGYTIDGARKVFAGHNDHDSGHDQVVQTLSRLASRLQKYRSVGA